MATEPSSKNFKEPEISNPTNTLKAELNNFESKRSRRVCLPYLLVDLAILEIELRFTEEVRVTVDLLRGSFLATGVLLSGILFAVRVDVFILLTSIL